MTCFKLPKTSCDKLSSAMANFWWNSEEYKKKIHWLSWDKLCIPKDAGGLGFKDIQLFNQALLAKQAWRLIQFPNCLMAITLKSRYFVHCSFLDAKLGVRPSFAWRSILHSRDLLVKGLRYRIRDGNSIKIWTFPWIKDITMRAPLLKNIIVDIDQMVGSLIDHSSRSWNRSKLDDLFFQRDSNLILKIKPVTDSADFWSWEHNHSGDYSVKSGYWLACEYYNKETLSFARLLPSINCLKDQIWLLQTAPKIKSFLWKVLSGALPVAVKFASRGMKVDTRCQSCGFEGESANHILFMCPVARQVWALSKFPSPPTGFDLESIYQNIHYLLDTSKNNKVPLSISRIFPWTLWLLWKNRNKLIFDGVRFQGVDTMAKIHDVSIQWFTCVEYGIPSLLNGSSPLSQSQCS